MKFHQLIEHKTRFISEKIIQKCGGETNRRPFSKKLKLSISQDK